jgi:aspartate-semialdehyde dehydrogenase|tara:strand:- start:1035 stop:2024 length:990 start_codon:yes stop_codon:yes gene_type:complete
MRIGIVGASGAVGAEIIKILEERKFKVSSLSLFGSRRSAGKYLLFKKKRIKIKQLEKKSLKNLDLIFFSAGAEISKKFAHIATSNGAIVIDNSSAFRMDSGVPLIIPEINPKDIKKTRNGIVANPNCTTVISLMAIKPLHSLSRIDRVVATSFQSVSGAGARGMQELIENTKNLLHNRKKFKNVVFEREIAFNVIPKIGDITANLYSQEEMKLHNESRKILSDNKINFTATTVRVPVLRSHSISLNIEFKNRISIGNAIKALKKFPGLKVMSSSNYSYPTPIDATNRDDCIVGRIRSDFTVKNGISLWIVGDQIRKGAALNAVQIAELL